jgi:hypothetical protein
MVMANVWMGLIFGRTANEVSPTNPLDEDDTPEASTEKLTPNRLASMTIRSHYINDQRKERSHESTDTVRELDRLP